MKRLLLGIIMMLTSIAGYSQKDTAAYYYDVIKVADVTRKGVVLEESSRKITFKTFEGRIISFSPMAIEYRGKEGTHTDIKQFLNSGMPYRDPLVSTFMSFVLPGMGQMYNYESTKGVGFLLWSLASNTAAVYFTNEYITNTGDRKDNALTYLCISGASSFICWLTSMLDASVVSEKINTKSALKSLSVSPDVRTSNYRINGNNTVSYGLNLAFKF